MIPGRRPRRLINNPDSKRHTSQPTHVSLRTRRHRLARTHRLRGPPNFPRVQSSSIPRARQWAVVRRDPRCTSNSHGSHCWTVVTLAWYVDYQAPKLSPSSDMLTARLEGVNPPSPASCSNNNPLIPVANAGADITALPGSFVQLMGSFNNINLDGPFPPQLLFLYFNLTNPRAASTLTFLWSQISGPAVQLNGKDNATASFTAPTINMATMMVFTLQVSNNVGSSNDSVTVIVNPAQVDHVSRNFPLQVAHLKSKYPGPWCGILNLPLPLFLLSDHIVSLSIAIGRTVWLAWKNTPNQCIFM